MYATVQELEKFMEETFDVDKTTIAEITIKAATNYINKYTNRTFSQQTSKDILSCINSSKLYVYRFPLIRIISIKKYIEQTYISTDNLIADPAGIIRNGNFEVGTLYEVEYEHGYTEIPNDIKLACLLISNKIMSLPKDEAMFLQSEKIGKYEYETDSYRSISKLVDNQVTILLNQYKLEAVV